MAAHRTERLKPESANYSTERYRAGHYRFLVVLPTVLDLLIFAKHLFVAAKLCGMAASPDFTPQKERLAPQGNGASLRLGFHELRRGKSRF